LKTLGFLICCAGLLVTVLKLFGMEDWGKVIITSALLSAFFYYIFNNLLDVPLPIGIFFP
jgi:hypothetical protein